MSTEPSKALDKPNEITETFPLVDSIPLRLSFTPEAIREHYEDGDGAELEDLSDAMLAKAGSYALSDDGLYRAFHEALEAALSTVREEEGLPTPGWMDYTDVMAVAGAALPVGTDVRDGHAGGTVIVRCYLPDGRNVIITDGQEPFSGTEKSELLYLGLYASTGNADDGQDPYLFMEDVTASRVELTTCLLTLTGLPAHLCDEECGNPAHPHDGRLTPEN